MIEVLVGALGGSLFVLWREQVLLRAKIKDLEAQQRRSERQLALLRPESTPRDASSEDCEPGTCEGCDYDRATGELPMARVVRRPGSIL